MILQFILFKLETVEFYSADQRMNLTLQIILKSIPL